MGPFMYAILGSCKDVNIGPTAILSLMILPNVEALGPDMAVLMTFIAGCIIFLLGILQLGKQIIILLPYDILGSKIALDKLEISLLSNELRKINTLNFVTSRLFSERTFGLIVCADLST